MKVLTLKQPNDTLNIVKVNAETDNDVINLDKEAAKKLIENLSKWVNK